MQDKKLYVRDIIGPIIGSLVPLIKILARTCNCMPPKKCNIKICMSEIL